MGSQNLGIVKEMNLNHLRNAFYKVRTATKPQLAQLTGISVVTINSLVQILLKNGEIIENEMLQLELGRPAVSYEFCEEYSLSLNIYMHEVEGVDIGFFSVVNLYGDCIWKEEKSLEQVQIHSFDKTIEEIMGRYPNIKIIIIGMPGQEVDHKLKIIDYKGLQDAEFTPYLRDKFGISVIFENDINAATAGYCYRNGITSEHSVIGIYFPSKYPPGAGIFINGEVFKGQKGLAGEIKYLPFDVDWDTFGYGEEYQEIMIKTVLTFMCMYNPDTIVLYGERIRESIVESIAFQCKNKIHQLMLPKIILSNDFNSDFELGLKQIALQKLVPYRITESQVLLC